MKRCIIAGDRSGSGKTTVTMALLSALRHQGKTVQAFKVGPDYIDPMFHRAITGRPAYNLDPVLTSEGYVRQCFQRHSATATYAIVEGVMGLFDGAGGTDWASTAHVARLLNCPVLLVVDCARLSRSLAAIVHGYRTLDPRIQIAGVVLNRVGSDRHLSMLKAALASIEVPVLGVLRRDDAVKLPDRHLGLVPTDELSDLPERFRHLATLGQRCFDWPGLQAIFAGAKTPLNAQSTADPEGGSAARWEAKRCRIGMARDRAFNFYYEDNLTRLTELGAELVPFSPLTDKTLPPDLSGLLLGGGFPEMFAEELSRNAAMRVEIAQALAAGLPTYAECGGLMYLCQSLVDLVGQSRPMVGTLAATATMTGQLTLGYRQVTALQTSPLVQPGQHYWGHEFHRSVLAPFPSRPLSSLTAYPLLNEAPLALGNEGWGTESLHASYVHVHWGDRPELAATFVAHCDRFQRRR
jgi:cobyrinic acid a,c-diamide synthase